MKINNIKELIKTLFHKDVNNTTINTKMNQIYKHEYHRDIDFALKAPAQIEWVKSFNIVLTNKQGEKYLSYFGQSISQTAYRKFYWLLDSTANMSCEAIDDSKTYDVAVGAYPTYISIGSITNGILAVTIPADTVIPNGQLWVKSSDMGAYRRLYSTVTFNKVTSFPILDDMSSFNSMWYDDNYTPQLATTDVIGNFKILTLFPILITASEALPSAGIKTGDDAPFVITDPFFEYTLTSM